MRTSSRRFGSIGTAHPAATAPIPMDYQELLAEIARAEAFLARENTNVVDRVAVRLRLTRLEDARTAWDRHVVSTTLASVGA